MADDRAVQKLHAEVIRFIRARIRTKRDILMSFLASDMVVTSLSDGHHRVYLFCFPGLSGTDKRLKAAMQRAGIPAIDVTSLSTVMGILGKE